MPNFTPISSGVQFLASVLSEIDNAINERAATFGIASSFSTVSGTNIQDHNYWADRQKKIEQIVSTCSAGSRYFVRSSFSFEGVSPSVTNPYSGNTQLFWFLVTGHNGTASTAPRRRTLNPATDTTPGYCVAGDIIGYWLIQDLQSACQQMNGVTYKVTGATAHQLTKVPNLSNDPYSHWYATAGVGRSQQEDYFDHGPDTVFVRSVDVTGLKSYVVQHSGFWLTHWQSFKVGYCQGVCEAGTATISGLSSRSHTYQCYGVTAAPTALSPRLPTFYSPTQTTYVPHYQPVGKSSSIGVGELMRLASVSSASTSTSHTINALMTDADAYFDSTVPESTVSANHDYYGFNLLSETYWLVNYAYTYT